MTAPAPQPEDQARANLYALLARLFYAPPDRALLQALVQADDIPAADERSALASAWKELKAAAGETEPEAAREEYESVFVGTGKAEVTLYSSAYALKDAPAGAARNPLVSLRGFLEAQGLRRKGDVYEPEDHVAALCEVMRHLIMADHAAVQRMFYEQFIRPSAKLLCAAIAGSEHTRFYRSVGRVAACFFEIEQEVLKLE